MRDDVVDLLDHLGLRRVTVVGHSMGGSVAYLLAMQRADQVERLIVEDVPPPFRRDRPIPDRPIEPLGFDWAVAPAIVGGPKSHIPQVKLAEAAARIPRCTLLTIPAGHDIHKGRSAQFADTVLGWLSA